jgi:hypothetical protein
MRAIAEQNLNQSKAAFVGLLTIARSAVSGVDQQAAFIRDSMLFAEETLENTSDYAQKLIRMKEPQEFAQVQTEFVSRQAQVLAGSGQGRGEDHTGGSDRINSKTIRGRMR